MKLYATSEAWSIIAEDAHNLLDANEWWGSLIFCWRCRGFQSLYFDTMFPLFFLVAAIVLLDVRGFEKSSMSKSCCTSNVVRLGDSYLRLEYFRRSTVTYLSYPPSHCLYTLPRLAKSLVSALLSRAMRLTCMRLHNLDSGALQVILFIDRNHCQATVGT